jgi:hypothetical protein
VASAGLDAGAGAGFSPDHKFPNMVLTDEQKQAVATWIEDGAKPADVQGRLEKEFDLRMTYMEVRFLIDDLKVMPKDPPPPPEPPKPAEPEPADAGAPSPFADTDLAQPAGGGKVSVKVDEIMRPGAMVSGRATFSDGKVSEWYLDQYGRLGMIPSDPGYRPPQADMADFQAALEKELVRLGY